MKRLQRKIRVCGAVACSLLALLLAVSACGSHSKSDPPDYDPSLVVPLWVSEARIAGVELDVGMLETEIDALLLALQVQNTSVVEIETRLSDYLTDAEFKTELAFVKIIAKKVHALDMHAVVYYPALEVLTPEGQSAQSTMFKDHPEWVQEGLDGTPNVVYGTGEGRVDEGTESAWMSPNSGYQDYFLARVGALSTSGLDGIWIDVPLYLEAGTTWPGAEAGAAAAFQVWSANQGLAGGAGFAVPESEDFDDPAFRAWIRWRHENLADFQEAVRARGVLENPAFVTIVEDLAIDNMDVLTTGLDASLRRDPKNLVRVYKIDSVSTSNAMKYSSNEDFDSKIAMNKFAIAAEQGNPAWVYSFGSEQEDAALVMAAAMATGVNAFECKTPERTGSANTAFRTSWFDFIREHNTTLYDLPRHADAAIWYSSATRDYQDFVVGGPWGMYITADAPSADSDWWARSDNDTAILKPHLGGWRAAAHTLTRLAIPFRPVIAPGATADSLAGVPFLWLPSVAAMSDSEITIVKDFVMQGGTLLATGTMPATLDELGNARNTSALAEVFGTPVMAPGGDRAQPFGNGYAIYRGSFAAADTYFKAGDPDRATNALSQLQQVVRMHAPDTLRLDTAAPGLHVELAKESATKHWLYLVNYTGLNAPLVETVVTSSISYLPGPDLQVTGATAYSPDGTTTLGAATVTKTAEGIWSIDLSVDQFALVELTMAPYEAPVSTPDYAGPVFVNAERQRAAESGLRFILDKMRDPSNPEPANFGVFSNLLHDPTITEVFPHGHHVSSEHMGLLLRASACMQDTQAFDESYRFVSELMQSQLYGLCNWAVDRDTHEPFLQIGETDLGTNAWLSANAPLDDFRVIRGLIAGAKQLGRAEADALASVFFRGMLFTSISDMGFAPAADIPAYPRGLAAFAWDWQEVDNASLAPFAAESSGHGQISLDPIPVHYQDLYLMGLAAERDPRWLPIIDNATTLLLDSEISSLGLYYGGYLANGTRTGDYENQGLAQGTHLKSSQMLWTALHLASADVGLSAAQKALAHASAQRSLDFFKNFLAASVNGSFPQGRIPEYLKIDGTDVPNCVNPNVPAGCLEAGQDNLIAGEPRIYALLARLAILRGDVGYAQQLIDDHILPEWISNELDPRYGLIGMTTAPPNSADAWNVLESVLTICMAAGGES